jgi:hypothetical protein
MTEHERIRVRRYTYVLMNEHDKIEHRLPNGDILIVDSTRVDAEVQAMFASVKADLQHEARDAYRRLQDQRAAA